MEREFFRPHVLTGPTNSMPGDSGSLFYRSQNYLFRRNAGGQGHCFRRPFRWVRPLLRTTWGVFGTRPVVIYRNLAEQLITSKCSRSTGWTVREYPAGLVVQFGRRREAHLFANGLWPARLRRWGLETDLVHGCQASRSHPRHGLHSRSYVHRSGRYPAVLMDRIGPNLHPWSPNLWVPNMTPLPWAWTLPEKSTCSAETCTGSIVDASADPGLRHRPDTGSRQLAVDETPTGHHAFYLGKLVISPINPRC